MGTRSTIGILNQDGSVGTIYCHWDGYPAWVGKILLAHYNEEAKVRDLIALGDLSSMGETIGEKHDFDYGIKFDTESPEYKRLEKMCNAYGRDRGEKNVGGQRHTCIESANLDYGQSWCEFFYLFDTSTQSWKIRYGKAPFRKLTKALCKDCSNASKTVNVAVVLSEAHQSSL